MRVIAGQFRSRVLQAPKGTATRPTSDRLRETLFSVLGPRVEGSRFVDLYAGSGAVGIEAISRGAKFVWFAEKDRRAVETLRSNLTALKIANGFGLEDRSVSHLLRSMCEKKSSGEIVFLDPPYEQAEEYSATLEALARDQAALVAEDAIVVAEHARRTPLEERYGVLQRYRVLEQGDAALSFFRRSGGFA